MVILVDHDFFVRNHSVLENQSERHCFASPACHFPPNNKMVTVLAVAELPFSVMAGGLQ